MESDVVLPTNGVLKKWTNFVGGWQDRYFEIVGGNLVYYKSKADKTYGCRGSMALKNAVVTPHDFDECEFTVSMGDDVTWYMKAENAQSKMLWIGSLGRESNDSDYSSTSTKSHSRNPSLSSVLLTSDNAEDNGQLFSSRIAELEAYRTMCRDQMISIERILEQNVNEQVIQKSTLLSIKATHLALLVNVNHIIDLVKSGKAVIPETNDSARKMKSMNNINNNKVAPQHKPLSRMNSVQIAKEIPPKREISTKSNTGYASDDTQTTTRTFKADLDVTSDCDEWHDADDFKLSVDSGEEAMESRADTPVSVAQENTETPAPQKKFRPNSEKDLPFGHYDIMEIETTSNLFPFVDTLAEEQLKHALAGVEDNVWTLFAEDGAMKMYTREIEEGGLPVDPLKAVHQVKGVTALEFMHYFFDARYKKDWDHTLDSMSIVEVVARDTVVLHQKHKTVWPAAPRESLFVSHIRRVDNFKRDGAHDLYIVCNRNLERPDVPLGSSSSVRVGLTVSMVCETIVKNDEYDRPLTRDDVTCNIIYVSQVHPGGWVPTAALRHVYKKEYPKFLRTFTEYVLKNVKGKPVAI